MAISETEHGSPSHISPNLNPPVDGSGRPKKRGWLWFLIIAAIAAGGYYYYRSQTPGDSKAASAPAATRGGSLGPVSVAVATATKQDVPYYLTGLGNVAAFNTVTVKSRVDGTLQKVNFTEGQFVKEGDLLAQIDPRPYQVALAQMEGQLARDTASLVDARTDFERYTSLVKEGVIAQQQLDTQKATVGQLDGAIRADQAMIDNQKLQLVYCQITAPISGRVGLRLVDQGNMVHATDANGLVVITQVQPIAALFTLPEDSLPDVIKHMRSGEGLTIEAYSRDQQTKLATGKLLTINNQIDPTTGTVQLKGQFANSDLSLWPNQFINIRLMLSVRENAVVIPLAAVQNGTQGTYVYTVKDGHAKMQPVKVDLTQGNISLIASGVTEGDQVVVDGQDRLQSGSAVQAHSVAPSPSSAQAAGSSQHDDASKTGGAPGKHHESANGDPAPGPGSGKDGSAKHAKHEQAGKQNE